MARNRILAASAIVTGLFGLAACAAVCDSPRGVCSIASPPSADNALTAAEKKAGWQLLFDGKTLGAWACTDPNSKGWEVDNGAILYNVKGGGMLYSKQRFGNFELKIDFMVDEGTNSGVFFRWDDLRDAVQTGIEMQVLDSAAESRPGKHSCGAIYDVLAPSENAMKPALQWNSALLRCKDNFISITLNGKRIIQMDLNRWKQPHKNPDGTGNKFNTAYKDMPRVGHIGLQNHGGKVWFRNIKIRKLK